MYNKSVVLLVALFLLWSVSDVLAQDSHDGHEHGNEQEVQDEHADCDHGHEQLEESDLHDDHSESDDHDDHSDHEGDELTVELTPDAVKLAGITFSKVKHGRIGRTVELPGEIGFNEDRLAHIVPRFAGIVLRVNCRVGDYIEKGMVVAVVESNESMNSYSITAPISGWVIERHLTLGEFVSEENSIFVIADLSTVWVNLAVYPKDANRIKKGKTAIIKSIGTGSTTTGTIEYVTPIIDPRTRSLTARITLPNPDNVWRPGSFVQATITTEAGRESLVVEKNAVQYLDGESVVFVADGPNKFRPVVVVTGDIDANYTQITMGLNEGTKYVSTGAFELKAKIVTSNLDAHAGHGH
ncbi:MAG: efflux RND transporter periplasmic adaptor subunit [candidate division Zixibacteria bacterium]|nr:efflux RND transporter periplasmic adaptor subunit [candidate division Zixibacteria bacterium]